ncbi:MAG TPA: SRPBCC family protein [Acidimicrobiia bacterium]|jgi:hypothetical protein|nr:SRPBCC family protein [Acidimicrobiia bacterium]
MTRIEVAREIDAPHERVWEAVSDLGSHGTWMKDAVRIVFVGDRRSGEGTRMEVVTVVGPFRLLDRMEVTGWEEGRSIEVAHQGLVKGQGRLTATPIGDRTRVRWEEDLVFPWWLGGRLTAWLARPVLARIWRGNLRRLEETFSAL